MRYYCNVSNNFSNFSQVIAIQVGLPGKIITYDDAMTAPELPFCCPESIALTYQLKYAYVLIVYPKVLSNYPNICLFF